MTLAVETKREFKVGTTGWSVDDLDDPKIERLWEQGRYEIVEGVLTEMPAAYHDSGRSTTRLATILQIWLDENDLKGGISTETDLVLNNRRIPRANLLSQSISQERRQRMLSRHRG